jgi:hypothetical protein
VTTVDIEAGGAGETGETEGAVAPSQSPTTDATVRRMPF